MTKDPKTTPTFTMEELLVTPERLRLVADLAKDSTILLASWGPAEADLMHAALGLAGETLELVEALTIRDKVNFSEELGDMDFYLTMIIRYLDEDTLRQALEMSVHTPIMHRPMSLIKTATLVVDLVKKWVVYEQHELKTEVTATVALLLVGMSAAAKWGEAKSMIMVRHNNTNKLLRRYPEGTYTDADAKARADKD